MPENFFDQFDETPTRPRKLGSLPAVPRFGQVEEQQIQRDKESRDAQKDVREAVKFNERNDPVLKQGYRWKGGVVGGEAEPIPGLPLEGVNQPKTPEQMHEAQMEAMRNIRLAQDLQKSSKNDWFATGAGATIARQIGGTSAYDAAANVLTLQGATALDKIIALKQTTGNSPLGVLSNSDLELIKATVANLDTGQSDETFQKNLGTVIDKLSTVLTPEQRRKLNIKEATDVPELSTKVGNDFEGGAGGMASRGATSEIVPIKPELQADYNAWLDSKGRGFDPQDYAVMRMSLDRKYGYGVDADTFATYVEEGKRIADPASNVNRTIPGVETPLSQIDQARNNLARTDLGAAATTGINAVTLGIPTLLAGQEGVDANAQLRAEKPIPAFTGEVVGGIIGAKGVGAALGASGKALGLSQAALARSTGAVATNTVQGGVTGFNNGGGSVEQGVTGAALGGGITRALKGTGAALANRPSAIASRETLDAAERQGVKVLRADLAEGNTAYLTKALTSGAAVAPISGGSIRSVARKSLQQMGEAANRAARMAGVVLPEDQAGEIARTGLKKHIEEVRKRGGQIFEAARQASQGVKIKPLTALNEIDAQIAAARATGPVGQSSVRALETLKASLGQKGGIGVDALRQVRTEQADNIARDGLRGSNQDRLLKDILKKADDDMQAGLRSVGKDRAAVLYKRGSIMWAERIRDIDEVFEPIIGRGKSGEDVLRAVESMATGSRGGVVRLRRMFAAMPPSERGDMVATIIDRAGRATASTQDDAGGLFSASTFLTNWNKMKPAAKVILFDDPAVRSNLDDIARLSSKRADTMSLANRSNTGVALTGNVAGLGATALANPMAPFALGAAQFLTGQMLANPRIIRSIAKVIKINTPERRAVAVRELQGMAARLPESADQIASLSDYIKGAK